jgi:hypothetical protein
MLPMVGADAAAPMSHDGTAVAAIRDIFGLKSGRPTVVAIENVRTQPFEIP